METLVLMVHASGLPQLELQQLELVDYNYVQMQLLTYQHIQDVLHFQPKQLAPPQEPPAFLKPYAHHIQYRLAVCKDQMVYVSGQQQPQQLQLAHQFVDSNYAQIPY